VIAEQVQGRYRLTRLAPSPTGALHPGNARTFLINWALAKQNGWRILLRIEDLDTPRVKAGADVLAIEDLRWLGLDWDVGPVYQKADLGPCEQALKTLGERGLIYPCKCTRRQIRKALSAPHGDEHETRYPGTCRPGNSETVPPYRATLDRAWRLIVPDEQLVFEDAVRGRQSRNVQRQVGDFVVATKLGLPAYQLAVVVDDARQGVTDIVRGDDLLDSTARQLWLYRFLEPGERPCYWHLPLVVGEDGRRLAKRHGDTRLARFREAGVRAERIVGLLARWSGVTQTRHELTTGEFAERFRLDRLPPEQVVFTQKDREWLMDGRR